MDSLAPIVPKSWLVGDVHQIGTGKRACVYEPSRLVIARNGLRGTCWIESDHGRVKLVELLAEEGAPAKHLVTYRSRQREKDIFRER